MWLQKMVRMILRDISEQPSRQSWYVKAYNRRHGGGTRQGGTTCRTTTPVEASQRRSCVVLISGGDVILGSSDIGAPWGQHRASDERLYPQTTVEN
jgi:hypothetical protein